MSFKKCTRCGFEKELKYFQIRKASKDGYTASCKKCLAEYDKSRGGLPHRVHARIVYQQTEAGREASRRARKRFINKYPEKRKAHILVGNFLRDGKLIKPSNCSSCHGQSKLQAHHCDYTKPLDVMWLCSSCHKEWHKHNTPIYAA